MGYEKFKKHRPAYFHIMKEAPFGNNDLTGTLGYNISIYTIVVYEL